MVENYIDGVEVVVLSDSEDDDIDEVNAPPTPTAASGAPASMDICTNPAGGAAAPCVTKPVEESAGPSDSVQTREKSEEQRSDVEMEPATVVSPPVEAEGSCGAKAVGGSAGPSGVVPSEEPDQDESAHEVADETSDSLLDLNPGEKVWIRRLVSKRVKFYEAVVTSLEDAGCTLRALQKDENYILLFFPQVTRVGKVGARPSAGRQNVNPLFCFHRRRKERAGLTPHSPPGQPPHLPHSRPSSIPGAQRLVHPLVTNNDPSWLSRVRP